MQSSGDALRNRAAGLDPGHPAVGVTTTAEVLHSANVGLMRTLGRVVLLLLLMVGRPAAADVQVLDLQISMPSSSGLDSLDVEVLRLGQTHMVRLTDDGSMAHDLPGDGLWSGQLAGPYARTVSVRILGHRSTGTLEVLYSGIERTEDAHHVMLGWRVRSSGSETTVARTPISYPGSRAEMAASLPLIAGFGWGLFILIYVGMLVRMRRAASPEQ